MKKILLIIVVIIVGGGIGAYFYAYKGHRDIAGENADFAVSVSKLQQDYKKSDSLFNKTYADKTIEITGKITAIDQSAHSVVIDEKLSAVFTDSVLPAMQLQQPVKLKGRFLGYDDLLEEFSVDQASLSK